MEEFMYSYGMEAELMEFMEEIGFVLLGVLAVLAILVAVFGIVFYVLNSIGLHTIAKRRGIHHAWLAWIPLANYWVLGCISDQYQYVVKGKVKNKRRALLILGIVTALLSGTTQGANIANLIAGIENPGLGGGMLLMVFGVVNAGVSLAMLVLYYIALFDLYTSCVPANNVLYLVFSILFRVTEPFFVFFSRKKDGGMPPRREESRQYTQQEYTCVEPEPQPQQEGPELL